MSKRSAVERPKYITLCLYLSNSETKVRLTHLTPEGEECALPTQLTAPEIPVPPEGAVVTVAEPGEQVLVLPARDWYVWRRYGGPETVLPMIADPERCAHCDEERVNAQTTNGWFCLGCQRSLANLDQLPDVIST